jgi:hypothetical protein
VAPRSARSVPRLAPAEACTTMPHAHSLGSSHCWRAALLANAASCARALLPPQHPALAGAALETGKRGEGDGLRRMKTVGTERHPARSRGTDARDK